MRAHLNTSFTHSNKRKKKTSCFSLLCPQLLLVNRSAVSFLEDDLPQNQGGAAVEQGGGCCCCKHNSQSSREIRLHQQVKIRTKEGVRQGNLWLTWLHKWLQTWSNQLTLFVPFFSVLLHTAVAYVSHHVTPEKKKESRLFCFVLFFVRDNPSGKHIIFPSPARLRGLSFPYFNYIHVFSPSHILGKMLLLFKLLVLL